MKLLKNNCLLMLGFCIYLFAAFNYSFAVLWVHNLDDVKGRDEFASRTNSTANVEHIKEVLQRINKGCLVSFGGYPPHLKLESGKNTKITGKKSWGEITVSDVYEKLHAELIQDMSICLAQYGFGMEHIRLFDIEKIVMSKIPACNFRENTGDCLKDLSECSKQLSDKIEEESKKEYLKQDADDITINTLSSRLASLSSTLKKASDNSREAYAWYKAATHFCPEKAKDQAAYNYIGNAVKESALPSDDSIPPGLELLCWHYGADEEDALIHKILNELEQFEQIPSKIEIFGTKDPCGHCQIKLQWLAQKLPMLIQQTLSKRGIKTVISKPLQICYYSKSDYKGHCYVSSGQIGNNIHTRPNSTDVALKVFVFDGADGINVETYKWDK